MNTVEYKTHPNLGQQHIWSLMHSSVMKGSDNERSQVQDWPMAFFKGKEMRKGKTRRHGLGSLLANFDLTSLGMIPTQSMYSLDPNLF